jgi:hypothetical protein
MTIVQHDLIILTNAVELGFDQEKIMDEMHPAIFEFAKTLDIKEVYPHLFEKVIQYAEKWICDHQVEPFIKEMYIDLHYKCSFSFKRSDGSWVDVDDFGPHGLIDWSKYKDCQDTDKIFFLSWLDSDLKTVLKFYELGSKRHLV